MKITLFLLCLVAAQLPASAQFSRYIIRLKDKAGTPYFINDPSRFLTGRSIERRTRYGIPLDSTDLPINPAYLDSIRASGNVTILNESKWLNQVCIQTTDASALNKIRAYPFVLGTAPIAARTSPAAATGKKIAVARELRPLRPMNPDRPTDLYNYGTAYPQVSLHAAQFLHDLGFRGEGMQLAMMDAGFYHYRSLPTFDSILQNNQVLGTWDFVANESSVDEDNAHGMQCLSTIAANNPGSFIGTSPKTSFYLFRTEDASAEYPVEEQNWAAAAEKADSLGADVFSVSLGYNIFDNSSFNYTYADMDGNTSIIARACDLSARKGILVVVAAGNDGNNDWKYLSTPADADSVLTVGAVGANRQVAGFSSFGPSSDGQIKPDVAAIGLGTVVADQNSGAPVYGNGTSFACPVMAGIATCLWQAFPEVNNMALIAALRASSDKWQAPDDRTGYGIPNVKNAFVFLLKKQFTQQVSIVDTCKTLINFRVKTATNMNIEIQRKLPAEPGFTTISTLSYTGSFSLQDFSYTDDLSILPAGISIRYRLKMNIATDTSFYLDSATVNYSTACSSVTENIIVSPNPVTDQLGVQVASNSLVKATIALYTISGQRVYLTTEQLSGSRRIMVPMKHHNSGIYILTVFFDDKKIMVKKVVKD